MWGRINPNVRKLSYTTRRHPKGQSPTPAYVRISAKYEHKREWDFAGA